MHGVKDCQQKQSLVKVISCSQGVLLPRAARVQSFLVRKARVPFAFSRVFALATGTSGETSSGGERLRSASHYRRTGVDTPRRCHVAEEQRSRIPRGSFFRRAVLVGTVFITTLAQFSKLVTRPLKPRHVMHALRRILLPCNSAAILLSSPVFSLCRTRFQFPTRSCHHGNRG